MVGGALAGWLPAATGPPAEQERPERDRTGDDQDAEPDGAGSGDGIDAPDPSDDEWNREDEARDGVEGERPDESSGDRLGHSRPRAVRKAKRTELVAQSFPCTCVPSFRNDGRYKIRTCDLYDVNVAL